MIVVEATRPSTRMNLDLRISPSGAASGDSARTDTGRPLLVRALLVLGVVATLVWLVAAPSTPALIAVVSALIGVIGWADGPDYDREPSV